MPYIIGGRGLPGYTQLQSNLIPDAIQFAGVYIDFPEVHKHPEGSPLKRFLTKIPQTELAKALALRVVGFNPPQDQVQIPTAQVYGRRTIQAPPKIQFDTNFSVTFAETRAPSPYDLMMAWSGTVFSWTNGFSWHYVPPEIQATVYYYVFSQDLRFIMRREVYYGVYPAGVPSEPKNTNVNNTDLVTFTQNFRYSIRLIGFRDGSYTKPVTDDQYAQIIVNTVFPGLAAGSSGARGGPVLV